MAGELAKPDAEAASPTRGPDRPSRIGWEFWERPPPTPFPLEEQAPKLDYPAPRSVEEIRKQRTATTSLGTALICLAVPTTVAGVASSWSALLLVGVVLLGLGLVAVAAEFVTARWAKRAHSLAVEAADAEYRLATASWEAERTRWYAAETERVKDIPTYYSLLQADPRRRLDVFGGQPAGWASLLNTLARPLIDEGVGVSILDFTESSVGVELCIYAADAGSQVRYGLLPADLHRVDLLAGLTAAEVAEVLVAAAHAVRNRRGREDEEHHEVDAAIVAEVCRLLAPQGLTIQRIVAGLDIANQAAGAATSALLSADERTGLEDSSYLRASANRVRERYPYLRPRLGALETMGTTRSADATALPRRGDVSLLAVEGSSGRDLSLLANLAAQCVSQRLREQRAGGDAPLIVVAGADLLTYETITTLSRRARQAGARAAFLYAGLEDDGRRVLGAEGSDTAFFQLQNHEQAQFAADFIGRRHRFVIGQITKSAADAFGGSHGESRSWTKTVSETETRGVSYSGLFKILGDSKSRSTSIGTSFSDQTGTQWSSTWQQTETYGETATRVYEYDTEPRAIQELDTSSFIFVSRVGGRTRVSAGDCNPGIERLPFAVDYPGEACALRAAAPETAIPAPGTPTAPALARPDGPPDGPPDGRRA